MRMKVETINDQIHKAPVVPFVSLKVTFHFAHSQTKVTFCIDLPKVTFRLATTKKLRDLFIQGEVP